MPRVVKRSASQALKSAVRPSAASQSVYKPPTGPQWLQDIKLNGFRMPSWIAQLDRLFFVCNSDTLNFVHNLRCSDIEKPELVA